MKISLRSILLLIAVVAALFASTSVYSTDSYPISKQWTSNTEVEVSMARTFFVRVLGRTRLSFGVYWKQTQRGE